MIERICRNCAHYELEREKGCPKIDEMLCDAGVYDGVQPIIEPENPACTGGWFEPSEDALFMEREDDALAAERSREASMYSGGRVTPWSFDAGDRA